MAVISTAAVSPKKTATPSTKAKKRKNHEEISAMQKTTTDASSDNKRESGRSLENPDQSKKSEAHRVRVIGKRVYDSVNGKSCHQCRQKTLDFAAGCKNMKKDKQCTIRFCHKCLLNRYGEKAENVNKIEDWKCPKCRDICNCSFCMKKKGQQPTGILAHTAKASGFTSVSELLRVNGPEVASQERALKAKKGSTKHLLPLKENGEVHSLAEPLSEAIEDNDNASKHEKSVTIEEKPKKKKLNVKSDCLAAAKPDTKKKGFAETKNANRNDSNASSHEKSVFIDKKPKKKNLKSDKPAAKPEEVKGNEFTETKEANMDDDNASGHEQSIIIEKKPKKKFVKVELDNPVEAILPSRTEITNLVNIDMSREDVGNSLQFLEFCAAFGKILEIRKGQPECILRDIMCGRNRRGKCSSLLQFQIQLLTLIRKDFGEESTLSPTDGKGCWLHVLKECASEHEWPLKDMPENCLDGTQGYELLSPSQKLKLIVLLCDEMLGTMQVRTWIEEQNLKFLEKNKEAKQRSNAARDMERAMKKKIHDEIAAAILGRNGAPLSIAEHEAILSEIKAEAARAQSDKSGTMRVVPKNIQSSEAVRITPVFLDAKGHVYWRLKGFNESRLLLQDLKMHDASCNERWYSFNEEETKAIEEHISLPRNKRQRRRKDAFMPEQRAKQFESRT